MPEMTTFQCLFTNWIKTQAGQSLHKPNRRQGDSLHDFRHTFASQMLHHRSPRVEVKESLGQRKIEPPAIYLHYIIERSHGAADRLFGKMQWTSCGENVIAAARTGNLTELRKAKKVRMPSLLDLTKQFFKTLGDSSFS